MLDLRWTRSPSSHHEDAPEQWVSIDPGDSYVGWVNFNGPKPVHSIELTPWECMVRLNETLPVLDLVVVERWTLYGWNEKSLAGNEFLTSQLIGVIKYMTHVMHGVPFVAYRAREGKATTYKREPWCRWTTAMWKEALQGPIGRGHTKDALAQGYSHLWNLGYRP